ncbi:conserved hypothetical protein [Gloeothece citriformis PCC 7424]|uniref:SMP-30/Gluconolaconase/LRE domain protein n=1 Tax=Gloeothece citriformis (strain PCC 7424) TaxID=65393 RepID=B7KJT5_GLOC7|nr:gluconolaconase [Gloeothece citriformis]ACK69534.1 conserved hypothetical protein [Gloeothece citriformis PCC 7424]
MLKYFLAIAAFILIIAFSLPHSVAQHIHFLPPIELPTQFQYPNGITRSSDGTLYVGSIISGQIVRINPDGKAETFFEGNEDIFAGTSLRLDEKRGILWGASPDFVGGKRPHRIFALDTSSGRVLRVILMPDGGFGNDMAIDENGGVYLTDSRHPRIYYLPPGASQLQIYAEDERWRSPDIGLAGIARSQEDVIVVGVFSEGKLFKVTPQPGGQVLVEPIPLSRELENPDGIQFAADGSILLTEAALKSGEGRLIKINLSTPNQDPFEVKTIAKDLNTPVNLTLDGQQIWLSESRFRHRLISGQENNIPDSFLIHRIILEKTE